MSVLTKLFEDLAARLCSTEFLNDARHPDHPTAFTATSVYQLDDSNGDLYKYGITDLVGNEMERYSLREYAAMGNPDMHVIATFNNRAQARMLEMFLCYGYAATHGHIPPGSKRCRYTNSYGGCENSVVELMGI